eukprot:scaffold9782_cov150-Amphora_coffeaeformis.AAC.2
MFHSLKISPMGEIEGPKAATTSGSLLLQSTIFGGSSVQHRPGRVPLVDVLPLEADTVGDGPIANVPPTTAIFICSPNSLYLEVKQTVKGSIPIYKEEFEMKCTRHAKIVAESDLPFKNSKRKLYTEFFSSVVNCGCECLRTWSQHLMRLVLRLTVERGKGPIPLTVVGESGSSPDNIRDGFFSQCTPREHEDQRHGCLRMIL